MNMVQLIPLNVVRTANSTSSSIENDGSELGAALRTVDGILDGAPDGINDGMADGCDDGVLDGPADGSEEGLVGLDDDGTELGLFVSPDPVGRGVGLCDGDPVGLLEGCEVGIVGDTLGVEEGPPEGTLVGELRGP